MPSKELSCYILTCNSERYLASVIEPIYEIVDDLVIVDSGSIDRTEEIAAEFKARFLFRKLDNFRDQRRFALEKCRHQWVLSLDSDEVPDADLVKGLRELKANDFRVGQPPPDVFKVNRRWFVLGQEIHAFYPVTSPDHPARLFRKDKMTFPENERVVHETPRGTGPIEIAMLPGSILHYSCNSIEELYQKMNLYTSLAAEDLRQRGKQGHWRNILTHPIAAWFRWYLLKNGWKDGQVGWVLGRYAYDYTYQKYLKLRYDARDST